MFLNSCLILSLMFLLYLCLIKINVLEQKRKIALEEPTWSKVFWKRFHQTLFIIGMVTRGHALSLIALARGLELPKFELESFSYIFVVRNNLNIPRTEPTFDSTVHIITWFTSATSTIVFYMNWTHWNSYLY